MNYLTSRVLNKLINNLFNSSSSIILINKLFKLLRDYLLSLSLTVHLCLVNHVTLLGSNMLL